MTNLHSALLIGVIAAVTALLRFLPFWVFAGRRTPAFITYLGRVLPYAVMGMLVIYCLRGISFVGGSHGIPELVSVALVALLHLWKRNTLLSIISGTVCYMLLVQVVFK